MYTRYTSVGSLYLKIFRINTVPVGTGMKFFNWPKKSINITTLEHFIKMSVHKYFRLHSKFKT